MHDAERPKNADGAPAASRWVEALAGDPGERLRRTLDALPLDALSRYPLPKRGGLPLGRELSVLRKALRGRSVQLQPSGLWRAYVRFARADHRLLYRAFTVGEALRRDEWRNLLGADRDVAEWEAQSFLLPAPQGPSDVSHQPSVLRAAFRVVSFAGLRLLVDAFAHQERFADRVHVGGDTLTLLDALPGTLRSGRHLDVGTGSGALLFAGSSEGCERVGVDINRRAVEVARFNAALNRQTCTLLAGDVFAMKSLGRFDRVTWNLPFHFLPPAERADNVDGDGGELGIELTVRFLETLPELLTDSGRAWLLTSSPTLRNGSEALVDAVRDRAKKYRIDLRITSIQALWSPARRRFLDEHGVRRIDNVVLEVGRGNGRVERVAAPVVQRAVDWVQSVRYAGGP